MLQAYDTAAARRSIASRTNIGVTARPPRHENLPRRGGASVAFAWQSP